MIKRPNLAPLRLTTSQLLQVRDQLAERIQEGLEAWNQEIQAIPAYLAKPKGDCQGQAIVVDTGGTNMRAALVNINEAGELEIMRGPLKATVPTGRDGQNIDAKQFFLAQAQLAQQLNCPSGLPVGYCFSYPAEILPDTDAKLIRWTKAVNVAGVVGTRVGQQLAEAMAELGIKPSRVTVLNDTVAALLAGAGSFSGKYVGYIGLIAGTGTNMASFVPTSNCSKLPKDSWPHEDIAINYESGNFNPPHLSEVDCQLDASTMAPGTQRFEKAVSGFYLPYIYKYLAHDDDLDPAKGTAPLVARRDSEGDEVARAVLQRSSDLLAAGLAGLMKAHRETGEYCIVAEGSRYWQDRGQHEYIQCVLQSLVMPEQGFDIFKVSDANLLGSAYAALSRA